MNVILSIKPKFADAILAGYKKVEFRKSLFKQNIDKVLLYSTSPVRKIVGYFIISYIVENTPTELWEEFGDVGCIQKDDFFKYFGNTPKGYSICFSVVHKLEKSIDPFILMDHFTPPQSFCYYSGNIDSAW